MYGYSQKCAVIRRCPSICCEVKFSFVVLWYIINSSNSSPQVKHTLKIFEIRLRTRSVAATRPAVSRLTKPRLFSDSTGPTAPYLLESRLRLGRDFQSTQVDFFCLFFSFQNYILQHIKKHKVLLFYYVNVQCASYKLVTFIWTALRVNPAHMKCALLEMTIKMLHIIHHPCHFNASLKRQMTLRLHFPLHARRSPWPDFGWV